MTTPLNQGVDLQRIRDWALEDAAKVNDAVAARLGNKDAVVGLNLASESIRAMKQSDGAPVRLNTRHSQSGLRGALERIASQGVAPRVRPTGEKEARGCLTCGHWWDVDQDEHHDSDCAYIIARDALAAAPEPPSVIRPEPCVETLDSRWYVTRCQLPKGWRLVPEQWTTEMAHAGYMVHQNDKIACAECGDIYRAMLAAAPEPPFLLDAAAPEPLDAIPEGCTPADAEKLREASAQMAQDIHGTAKMVTELAAPIIEAQDAGKALGALKFLFGYFDQQINPMELGEDGELRPRAAPEPPSGRMPLRCPKCDRATTVARHRWDYPEAVRMELLCPSCSNGDFAEPFYFDAAGKHITRDPNITPTRYCLLGGEDAKG